MLKRTDLSLLATLITLVFCLPAFGQSSHPLFRGASRFVSSARVVGGVTDREQDGLNGPVRRVRTETAKLANKNGKLTEGQRVALEVAAYDIKGVKIENAYFPVPGSAVTGKEVYKYDDKGNIIEMTLQDEKGTLLSKETYTYEFDQFGNWTKMTTSVAVIENGKVTFEPTEITYRNISYYLDEATLAKMNQPAATAPATTSAANTAAPPTSSANTTANPAASNSNSFMPATTQPASSKPAATNTTTPASTNTSSQNQSSQTVAANNKPAASNSDAVKQPATQPSTSSSNPPPMVKTSAPVNEKSSAPASEKAKETASKDTANKETASKDNASKDKPAESKASADQASTPIPKPLLRPVSGGVLNGKAVSLPKPFYPLAAKSARMTGVVVVEVVIDVTGKVISARAISGPALLQQAATAAASQAKFSPTILSGQPVKVAGTINYNFSLN